jgi:vacuolar-type H+-ATPase subunit I/STV1
MKLNVLPKTVMLTAVIFALVSPTTMAKQMYRWVDEHGKVTFSDQVPPSQIQHKRETLDKNAQVVSVVEKPKTKEQLEMEKRLNAEKQRQEKLIAGQKTHDKMLLSSFLDATSMQASHDTKILALESQEKEKQSNIKKLEEDLKRLSTEVVTLEKSNKKTPDATRNAIEDNQKKIAQLQVEIKELQDKRAKINKDFAIDKERFDFLKSSENKTDTAATAAINEDKLNQRIGLFTCDTAEQCDKAWKIAKDFVKTNSTTKLNVDTDKLMMTNDPVRAEDLSLSVSKRLVENNKQQIFLDIRCVETVQGKEVCVNPKAESLRTQFSDYVRAALGVNSKPTAKAIEATPAEGKK